MSEHILNAIAGIGESAEKKPFWITFIMRKISDNYVKSLSVSLYISIVYSHKYTMNVVVAIVTLTNMVVCYFPFFGDLAVMYIGTHAQ